MPSKTLILLVLLAQLSAAPSIADERRSPDRLAAKASVSQPSNSLPRGGPERIEERRSVVPPSKNTATMQGSLKAGQPVYAKALEVTTRPVSPNALLEVPYCSTYQFRMETTGGWGRVRAEGVKGIRRHHYRATVETTYHDAGEWRLLAKNPLPAGIGASVSEIAEANAVLVVDGPAPNAIFDFQLTRGVRPIAVKTGFGESLDVHRGAVRMRFRDDRGSEVRDAVELKHVVHPGLLDPIVRIVTVNDESTRHRERKMLSANARYIGCTGDVPYSLLRMHVKPSKGTARTTRGARLYVDEWPKGTTFDVTLLLGGRDASKTVRVVL